MDKAAIHDVFPDMKLTGTPAQAGRDGPSFSLFGKSGPSFWDLLDVVNPLQHIPVVSNIYRSITGDEINNAARMAGGALFAGPIGVGAALVNILVESASGKDLGDHAIALFTGDDASDTMVADGDTGTDAPPDPLTAAQLATLTPPAVPSRDVANKPPPLLDHPARDTALDSALDGGFAEMDPDMEAALRVGRSLPPLSLQLSHKAANGLKQGGADRPGREAEPRTGASLLGEAERRSPRPFLHEGSTRPLIAPDLYSHRTGERRTPEAVPAPAAVDPAAVARALEAQGLEMRGERDNREQALPPEAPRQDEKSIAPWFNRDMMRAMETYAAASGRVNTVE